jgi:hypothetical protein
MRYVTECRQVYSTLRMLRSFYVNDICYRRFEKSNSFPLVSCVIFCRTHFCRFSFGHCVVCPTSIFGFWLPHWHIQTFPVCLLKKRWTFPAMSIIHVYPVLHVNMWKLKHPYAGLLYSYHFTDMVYCLLTWYGQAINTWQLTLTNYQSILFCTFLTTFPCPNHMHVLFVQIDLSFMFYIFRVFIVLHIRQLQTTLYLQLGIYCILY